ncbi:CheF family chemotaxis protein [Archaeoglobus profundus]|uniref:Taxis protein n=1 Tax=Archaeoglobus profundus (strain DSM 5631 / JCM 9629 / NBRC 100127 / Av18) TaxID=572546 RepID=D2RE82_ARCPA|nr:CheF family chemotaxis protein [Archaeoglobus profundus]ADB58426.1 Protein of unknown function DUF439 [Archaeoglobus profundus DSM 5631]
MAEKVLLKTPAELFEDGWRTVEVVITDRSISFGNSRVNLREIEDLERVVVEGKKAIRIKKDRDIIISFPEKIVDQIFKYLAFNLKSDRFAVYFLSPATVGGVVVKDAKWEKGYLSITDEAIWFLSPKKQIRIPFSNLGSVGKDIRTVGGKERVVLVVGHVENGEVVTSYILCPETTLEMLENYLNRLIDKAKPKAKLSEVEEQIAMMLYSGLSSVDIESILGITTEELNNYFDRLVNLGLAKVVKVRKELQLTPKGVALVNELMKKGR